MFNISFNLDIEGHTVTNVKVVNLPSKYDDIDLPVVEISGNKLILSSKAVELISASYGDRIAVNYVQKSNEITIPVIGKAQVFTDLNAGNRLTKSNTVSFKGTQKTILTKFGYLFRLEEFRGGMFKMVSINETDLAQTDPDLVDENIDLNLI